MAVMANWMDMSWEISPGRVAVLEGLSTSHKVENETGNDKEGSAPSNAVGFALQTIQAEYVAAAVAGPDVRANWEAWKNRVGKTAPFYLGGKLFGPDKVMLTEAGLDDVTLGRNGEMLTAKISLTFTEDAPEPAAQKSKSDTGNATTAVSVGASSADKASKKTQTIG